MSSKATRDATLKQFRTITNATPADATRILKNNNYRLDYALEDFYEDPVAVANAQKASASSSSEKKKTKEAEAKLGQLFDQYKEEDSDEIDIEGTQQYFGELELDLEDVLVLPLCYYLKAPAMGKFSRDGFVKGWVLLDRADTIDKQKEALSRLRTEFKEDKAIRLDAEQLSAKAAAEAAAAASRNEYSYYGSREPKKEPEPAPPAKTLFNETYEFTYGFGRREGQKSLDLDTAIAFWDLIMPHAPTFKRDGSTGTFTQGQLNMWKRFLKEKTNNRAISKDTWQLFLEFSKDINEEFSNHDEDGAWPSVIDDFVEWAKEEIAEGRGPGASMDED